MLPTEGRARLSFVVEAIFFEAHSDCFQIDVVVEKEVAIFSGISVQPYRVGAKLSSVHPDVVVLSLIHI